MRFAARTFEADLLFQLPPRLTRAARGKRHNACREGKGTHAALRRAYRLAHRHEWVAHLDVRKYFPSIDHDLLTQRLRRSLSCSRTLDTLLAVIEAGFQESAPLVHGPGDDLFAPLSRRRGLPIGNLTSQHLANFFLGPLDQLATSRLRLPYQRYMDDLLLFGGSKQELESACRAMEARAGENRLRLHPWRVQSTQEFITYLGFRLARNRPLIPKRATLRRAERRLRLLHHQWATTAAEWGVTSWEAELARERLFSSARSILVHLSHGNTYHLRGRLLQKIGLFATSDEQSNFPQ